MDGHQRCDRRKIQQSFEVGRHAAELLAKAFDRLTTHKVPKSLVGDSVQKSVSRSDLLTQYQEEMS